MSQFSSWLNANKAACLIAQFRLSFLNISVNILQVRETFNYLKGTPFCDTQNVLYTVVLGQLYSSFVVEAHHSDTAANDFEQIGVRVHFQYVQ